METGPLDLDRTAQVEGVCDLILSVHLGSDGSGWLGARGGGAVTPATQSRGGAAQGSPDLTVNGAPGVKLGRAWIWRDQRIMRDLPGAKAGFGVLWTCARSGGDGPARRRTPACGVPVPAVT
jgi:hypothetical protein